MSVLRQSSVLGRRVWIMNPESHSIVLWDNDRWVAAPGTDELWTSKVTGYCNQQYGVSFCNIKSKSIVTSKHWITHHIHSKPEQTLWYFISQSLEQKWHFPLPDKLQWLSKILQAYCCELSTGLTNLLQLWYLKLHSDLIKVNSL